MNTNLESGFLITEFCVAAGKLSERGNPIFDDVADVAAFLSWIAADRTRATTWSLLREVNDCDDAALIDMGLSDDQLGWTPVRAQSGSSGPFDPDYIGQIRKNSWIDKIVGEYIDLSRVGADSYRGHCPFHDKGSGPSFHVQPSTGTFHCFGCGEGGSVIDFVMKIDHLDFVSAVHKLDQTRVLKPPFCAWCSTEQRADDIHDETECRDFYRKHGRPITDEDLARERAVWEAEMTS